MLCNGMLCCVFQVAIVIMHWAPLLCLPSGCMCTVGVRLSHLVSILLCSYGMPTLTAGNKQASYLLEVMLSKFTQVGLWLCTCYWCIVL